MPSLRPEKAHLEKVLQHSVARRQIKKWKRFTVMRVILALHGKYEATASWKEGSKINTHQLPNVSKL